MAHSPPLVQAPCKTNLASRSKENGMASSNNLTPAPELAAKNKAHFPNESPEYRKARNALLAEEIELRRHIERVAAMRRAMPPGGEIPEDYSFESEKGPVRLSDLSATTRHSSSTA